MHLLQYHCNIILLEQICYQKAFAAANYYHIKTKFFHKINGNEHLLYLIAMNKQFLFLIEQASDRFKFQVCFFMSRFIKVCFCFAKKRFYLIYFFKRLLCWVSAIQRKA